MKLKKGGMQPSGCRTWLYLSLKQSGTRLDKLLRQILQVRFILCFPSAEQPHCEMGKKLNTQQIMPR